MNNKDDKNLAELNDRVWIYGAEIIIEFLSYTFIPTKHFLNAEGKIEAKTKKIIPEYFEDPKCHKSKKMTLDDLYDLYLMFREKQDYTAPVESKYKFSLIIGRLKYSVNGWEFIKSRFSRKQVIVYGPIMTREGQSTEMRKEYPIEKAHLTGGQVEVGFKHMQSEEDELIEKLENGCKLEYTKDWIEIKNGEFDGLQYWFETI